MKWVEFIELRTVDSIWELLESQYHLGRLKPTFELWNSGTLNL